MEDIFKWIQLMIQWEYHGDTFCECVCDVFFVMGI